MPELAELRGRGQLPGSGQADACLILKAVPPPSGHRPGGENRVDGLRALAGCGY